MINKKVILGVGLSLMVILGTVMVSSTSVFAEGTDSGFSAKFKGVKAGFFGGKTPDQAAIQEKAKTKLSELVSAGTITQAEADKVIEYYAKYCFQGKNIGDKVNPLEQLVKDGVLTQAKADAVAKVLPVKIKGVKGEFIHFKLDLSSLVSAGTITQAEADKVTEYLKKFHQDKSVNKTERINPFDQMVKEGVLTQEKADQIVKELPKNMHKRGHGFIKKDKPAESETSES